MLQEQLPKYKTDFENSKTKLGKVMSAGKAVAVAQEISEAPKVIVVEGNVKPETREFLNEAAKKSNVTIL